MVSTCLVCQSPLDPDTALRVDSVGNVDGEDTSPGWVCSEACLAELEENPELYVEQWEVELEPRLA